MVELKEQGRYSLDEVKVCDWKTTLEVKYRGDWCDILFSADAAQEPAVKQSRLLKAPFALLASLAAKWQVDSNILVASLAAEEQDSAAQCSNLVASVAAEEQDSTAQCSNLVASLAAEWCQALIEECSEAEQMALTSLVAQAKGNGKAKVKNDGRSVREAGSSVFVLCALIRSSLAPQCVLVVP